jgi:hypothetical protein
MWNDYAVPGGTFRENLQLTPGDPYLPSSHPAAQYKWDKEYAPWDGGAKEDLAPTMEISSEPVIEVPVSVETSLKEVTKGNSLTVGEILGEKTMSQPVVAIVA